MNHLLPIGFGIITAPTCWVRFQNEQMRDVTSKLSHDPVEPRFGKFKLDQFVKSPKREMVMGSLVQHLTKSNNYSGLKQVQATSQDFQRSDQCWQSKTSFAPLPQLYIKQSMCRTRFFLAIIKKTVFPNSYGCYRVIYKVSNLVSVQCSNLIGVFCIVFAP